MNPGRQRVRCAVVRLVCILLFCASAAVPALIKAVVWDRDDSAVPALRKLLDDPNDDVRAAAELALDAIE